MLHEIQASSAAADQAVNHVNRVNHADHVDVVNHVDNVNYVDNVDHVDLPQCIESRVWFLTSNIV